MKGTCEVIKDCYGHFFKDKRYGLYSGDKFNYSLVQNGKRRVIILEYKDIKYPGIYVGYNAFRKFFRINKCKFIYN